MFAKSKSSGSTPSVLLPNPLQNLYDVGKQTATAGPENAWRIYNGYTKADRKVILDRPIIPFRICFKSETLEIYSPRLFSSRNNQCRTSNYNSLEKVLLSKSIRNYLLFYYISIFFYIISLSLIILRFYFLKLTRSLSHFRKFRYFSLTKDRSINFTSRSGKKRLRKFYETVRDKWNEYPIQRFCR